jgi:hypothetical protein
MDFPLSGEMAGDFFHLQVTLEDFKSTITTSTKDSFELHFPLPGDPGAVAQQPSSSPVLWVETAVGIQMLVVFWCLEFLASLVQSSIFRYIQVKFQVINYD